MKLSVCIPVYNVAAYIEKCARSLLGQTYRDIEYVFVDDCSPDDSIAIVERVLKDYPDRAGQVKILHHERNGGLIAARKTAIRAATGGLIAHCDSDDWVDTDLYEKMIARMTEMDADIVVSSAKCYYAERTVVATCPDDICLSGPDAMRRADEIPGLNSMVTKVIRRDRVDLDHIEWPDNIRIGEDHCHMMQVLPHCRRLVGCSDGFYHYRVNANSVTRDGNIRRLLSDHARVYDILTRNVPGDESVVPRRHLVRALLYWGAVTGHLSTSDFQMWRERFVSLGGSWDWSDKSLWGQRMMKLANVHYTLARIVSPLVKRKIYDYL